MKRFRVIIAKSAIQDITTSYQWGAETWGKDLVDSWVRELRRILLTLEHLPSRNALAPESKAFSIEIRQIVFGRYRVLFTVKKHTVHILHLRGPYTAA